MSNDDMPSISPLREAAIQIHEMYVELKNAGFSRSESMELIAKVLSSMFNQQTDSNG